MDRPRLVLISRWVRWLVLWAMVVLNKLGSVWISLGLYGLVDGLVIRSWWSVVVLNILKSVWIG